MKNSDIATALGNLTPGAQWIVVGDSLTGITWLDTIQTRPTDAQITAQIASQGN